MIKYILTTIYIIFTTLGLFLMKIGGDSLSITIKPFLQIKIGYITLLGFLCYLCSFLLWQKLLVTFDVSYIVPITTAIVQTLIIVIGVTFFKEQINIYGIIGIIIVIIGVVLITIGKK